MDRGDGDSGFMCNICFESADKDPIVTLCGHLYCKSCIYAWLRNPRDDSERCPCPVCKAVIQENKLIPLYGIGKSQGSYQRSQSVPVDSVESVERQAGQEFVTTSAPNRPAPSAPEWPSDPRPTPSVSRWQAPSAPAWSTDPRLATPLALNCSTDQTLAIPSTANVILNQVGRLLIRVGQYMIVKMIEVATEKLIEVVETKIKEFVEGRNDNDEEGSGNSEDVEGRDSNGEESHQEPWIVLNQT